MEIQIDHGQNYPPPTKCSTKFPNQNGEQHSRTPWCRNHRHNLPSINLYVVSSSLSLLPIFTGLKSHNPISHSCQFSLHRNSIRHQYPEARRRVTQRCSLCHHHSYCHIPSCHPLLLQFHQFLEELHALFGFFRVGIDGRVDFFVDYSAFWDTH